jgi:hypothetical protein
VKLLLIADSLAPTSIFESRDDCYFFQSIQIDFIFANDAEDLKRIHDLIQKNRYHLILSIVQADFQGSFIDPNCWTNSVNHYASEKVKEQIAENYGHSAILALPSIVNKTTAYFNVFLEIQKAVSFTRISDETIDLSRLDILANKNYHIAFMSQSFNQPFYTLNYGHHFDKSHLIALLKKID